MENKTKRIYIVRYPMFEKKWFHVEIRRGWLEYLNRQSFAIGMGFGERMIFFVFNGKKIKDVNTFREYCEWRQNNDDGK